MERLDIDKVSEFQETVGFPLRLTLRILKPWIEQSGYFRESHCQEGDQVQAKVMVEFSEQCRN